MARRRGEQRAPEQVRILLRSHGQLVDEGFGEERVLRMVHAAPDAEGHMGRAADRRDALIGDGVGNVRRGRWLVLLHVDVAPRHGRAVLAQRAFEAADHGRAIAILGHVLFPRPHHLHGFARHRLGDARRAPHVVVVEAPPEGAAEIGVVDGHRLRRQLQDLRHRAARAERVLGSGPHVADAVACPDGAVHRFHRRVGEVGNPVFGVDALRRTGERGVDIAVFDLRLVVAVGQRRRDVVAELRVDAFLIDGILAVGGPSDVHRGKRLASVPVAVRHHRNGVYQVDHVEDARHGSRGLIVERLHRGAEDRRSQGGGDLEILHFGVDAEQRAAIDLGRNVQARSGGADQPVFVRRLQPRLRWRRDFGSRRGELGVGRFAAALRVGDPAVAQRQFVRRHAPGRSGGFGKHLPCRGPGRAHGMEAAVAHARAAAGDLQIHRLAELQEGAVHRADQGVRQVHVAKDEALGQRVVGVFLVRRRFLHAHVLPIRVQLVRQHLRQHRVDALAHLGVGNDCGDAVVRRDLDPGVQQRLFARSNQRTQARRSMAWANGDADRQTAAGQQTGGDESAPRPLAGGRALGLAHVGSPSVLAGASAAARLMARRMRP